jgi:preprotein translocase subunit YajC
MTSPTRPGTELLLFQDTGAQAAPPADTTTAGPPAGETTEGGGGSSFFDFLPFILIGVVFWFLLIAPERRNRKKRELMLGQLAKGDEVMTNGGIYGTVAKIDGDVITLKVAENVRMRFSRAAIQQPLGDRPAAKTAADDAGDAGDKD